jgi:L-alanine-DL-glutamate epimerase-like enolase superfamily enzyme
LRAEQHLPIIADDSAFTLRDLQRELAFDTFDILNIKTARTGFTESAAMLTLARRANKGVMIGSQASAGLGTQQAALFAALPGIDHPSELSFPLKLRADILDRPLPIVDGYLSINDLLAAQMDPTALAAPSRAV